MKKKILFWIDGDTTSFSIPYYLKEKLDFEAYAIIDTPNKPKKFYKEQNFINFNKFWFYHDFFDFSNLKPDIDYLRNFEKKFKINLWELAVNERTFHRFNHFYKFSNEEILKILETECKKFEEIINEIQPDFYISLDPNFHHDELLLKLLQNYGTNTMIINQPNFKKTIISKITRYMDECNLESISDSKRSFSELQEELKKYDIFKHGIKQRKFFKTSKIDLLKSAFYYLFKYDNSNLKTHYTYFGRTKFKVLFYNLKSQFLKSKRQKFIDNNLEKNFNQNENFIYFPLSVDEERNILLSSPLYTNQIEVIRSIAKSTPPGYTIYVKENPSQSIRYWRSIEEYQNIQNIPNVKLLHPSVSNEKLNKNCSLLISISGSAGFEAAFYGKSSIIFADLGYEILSSVTKINSFSELSSTIRNSIEKENNPSDLDKYMKLLDREGVDFDIAQIQMNYQKLFFNSGWIADLVIPHEKMKLFLNENKSLFTELIEKLYGKINSKMTS